MPPKYKKKSYRRRYAKRRRIQWNPFKSTKRSPNHEVMTCIQRVYTKLQISRDANNNIYVNRIPNNFNSWFDNAGQNSPYYSLALGFNLNDVSNYGRFTDLYDQYRITGIRLKIFPNETEVVDRQPVNFTPTGGTIYLTYDYDDTVPLGGIMSMLSREQVTMRNATKYIEYTIRPYCAQFAYNTTGTGSSAVRGKPGQWLDCANTNITHYGLKMVTNYIGTSSISYTAFDIIVEYKLEFREIINLTVTDEDNIETSGGYPPGWEGE